MKVHVLRVLAIVIGLLLTLGIAAPAQASTWSLKQTSSANPGCTKTWRGMNCDRANAWGVTAGMGLYAAKQTTGQNRAIATKRAVATVVAPLSSKSVPVSDIISRVGNSLTTNQALCMKEELQRTTNRVTAKSALAKNYYSYLKTTYGAWKGVPLAKGYQTALTASKGVVFSTLSDTERHQLRTNITGCLLRR